MKKFIIAAISLLVLVAPVYAARNDHSDLDKGNSQITVKGDANFHSEGREENGNLQFNIDATVSPTASTTPTVTTTPCDPSDNWKNHGEYVSCVAHEHLSGKEVSDAAKSDIGKKEENEGPTPPSETPSASPSPITSASVTISGGISPFTNFGSIFERFFNFFKHLL